MRVKGLKITKSWLILGRPPKDMSKDFFSRRDIVFLFGATVMQLKKLFPRQLQF